MRYVVWINEKGYYESYKSKIATNYTDNRHDAFEYLSLNSAITRLGISVDATSIEGFIGFNIEGDKVAIREQKLSKIMKMEDDIDISFVVLSKGRIEKVDNSGEFIGDVTDEVVKFIEDKIAANKKKAEMYISKFNRLTSGISYIKESKNDKDFWDGF